jgi:hypothetical protein
MDGFNTQNPIGSGDVYIQVSHANKGEFSHVANHLELSKMSGKIHLDQLEL